MRKFYKTKNYEAILRRTADEDPQAAAIRDSPRPNSRKLLDCAKQARGQEPEMALQMIMEGMAEYLKEYPAPPSYRQGLWETCKSWVDRIAGVLGIEKTKYDFCKAIPEPVAGDTGIALVKALHPAKGKTKKELGTELGVGEKTIQTGLRALDPSLSRGRNIPAPFRIAGQEMHVRITEEKDEETGKHRYHTKNRLHPIALQLNTMQVGNLLRALQEIDAAPDQPADNEVCRLIALDIWAQLSPVARTRLKGVYRSRYPEFGSFMDELEDDVTARLPEFHPERDMEPHLQVRQQLEMAMKGQRRCSLTLRRDGREICLQNAVIDWTEGDESYLAIPADPHPDREKAVRFWLEEVEGNLTFEQRPDTDWK